MKSIQKIPEILKIFDKFKTSHPISHPKNKKVTISKELTISKDVTDKTNDIKESIKSIKNELNT